MRRVVALDPGERVGWAYAHVDSSGIHNLEHGVRPAKDMALRLARKQGVANMRDLGTLEFEAPADVIVYETWRPHPKNGSMNWIQGDHLLSAQFVGQLRFIAWLSGAQLVSYGPEQKKVALASMPPEYRAMIDDPTFSSEQHDRDAAMHMWLYYFTNWFNPSEAE